MKSYSIFYRIFGVFIVVILVSGCQSEAPTPLPQPVSPTQTRASQVVTPTPANTVPEGEDLTVIAYQSPSFRLPFWKNVALGIRESADRAGLSVLELDSRQDATTQLQNTHKAIEAGVQAIILSPVDSVSAVEVLEVAKDAGVPVVICDIGTESGEYVSFVVADNYGGAKDLGAYLAQVMQERNGGHTKDVALITISLDRQNGRDRTEGFKTAVNAMDGQIVSVVESQDYTQAESVVFVEELLAKQPDLRALFTEHNEATLGALSALESAGKLEQVLHVGFDGTPETLQAVEEGRLLGLAVQQPIRMGREAFQATWDYLNGMPPDKKILVPTLLVTQDNIDTITPELEGNVYPQE